MTRTIRRNGVLGTAVVLLLSACAGQPMAPRPPAPQEPELTKVLRQLSAVEQTPGRSLLIGIGADPAALVAFDMETKEIAWQKSITALTGPIVCGQEVVIQHSDGIAGYRLSDGQGVFDFDKGGALVGAANEGVYTVVALDMGADTTPRGRLVGIASGAVAWVRDFHLRIGAPALANGIVIVPWASQRISMLDPATGDERARIQTDKVTSRVIVESGNVYLAGLGITRLGPEAEGGQAGALVTYEPTRRPLPGQPDIFRKGYEQVPPPDDASYRLRLVWKLAEGESSLGFVDGNLYLVFYRFIFAFDADIDTVKWVYQHPVDLVGAQAVEGGIWIADEAGELSHLSAKKGVETRHGSVGIPLVSANLHPHAGLLADGVAKKKKEKPGKLKEQLYAAAILDDARLVGGRALAIRYLADFGGEDVTRKLIDLCAAWNSPLVLRSAACDNLAERKKGARFVRAALLKQASFLKNEPPPPVGALAAAATQMKMRGVVAELVRHVKDPATPSGELAGAFEALGVLGTRETAESIEEFLRLYHAESNNPVLVTALGSAAMTLAGLKKQAALPTLEMVATDPFTSEKLRVSVGAALASLAPPPARKKEPKPVEDNRPEKLTNEMMQSLFKPIAKKLRKCLGKELNQIKIVMMVNPSGELAAVVANPGSAQECVEPRIRSLKFEATKRENPDKVVYVVRR